MIFDGYDPYHLPCAVCSGLKNRLWANPAELPIVPKNFKHYLEAKPCSDCQKAIDDATEQRNHHEHS